MQSVQRSAHFVVEEAVMGSIPSVIKTNLQGIFAGLLFTPVFYYAISVAKMTYEALADPSIKPSIN